MNKEQFAREKMYQLSLAVAKMLCKKGLLTEDELAETNKTLLAKYTPLLGALSA
jgi:transcription initiation factor IIE alpha subunit